MDDSGRVIYKYQLHTNGGAQIIHMPAGAKIVKVGSEGARVCLWALVNTTQTRMVATTFEIFSTGEPLPHYRTYVGTAFIGHYVWHVFKWEE